MFKKALILAGKDIKYMYRDRGAIIGSYLAPVLILVIFGIIYSGMGNSSNDWDIDLLVVDQTQTEHSQAFVESLKNESVFNITTTETTDSESGEIQLTEDRVKELILDGDATLGLVYHGEVENPDFPIDVPSMTLYYSPSAGMERQVTSGMIQRDVFMTMGTDLPKEGVDLMLEQIGLEGTPAGILITGYMNRWIGMMEARDNSSDSGGMSDMMGSMIDLDEEEVVNEEVERGNPFMANSVSGLIVMFLLFSVSYAAASLLKEQEGGTIKRLLMAPITVDTVILGKFLSIGFNSLCQVAVMLVVAEFAFHVNILGNLFPVIVISVATVAAVTAFGMIISALAKSHDQITASITVIVLVMSAIGGSMFPRILMPDWMQRFGLLTINGWSIVGYLDALYYYKGAGSMLGY
ncbi:MAG: ABC transporter permease, partial [bacterium]|nr:ABC transporter permease [bacterium]